MSYWREFLLRARLRALSYEASSYAAARGSCGRCEALQPVFILSREEGAICESKSRALRCKNRRRLRELLWPIPIYVGSCLNGAGGCFSPESEQLPELQKLFVRCVGRKLHGAIPWCPRVKERMGVFGSRPPFKAFEFRACAPAWVWPLSAPKKNGPRCWSTEASSPDVWCDLW